MVGSIEGGFVHETISGFVKCTPGAWLWHLKLVLDKVRVFSITLPTSGG